MVLWANEVLTCVMAWQIQPLVVHDGNSDGQICQTRGYCQHKTNWLLYNRCLKSKTHHNPIGSEIEIYYPFHPLFGAKLKIVRNSETKNGTIFVDTPKGFCKEIPSWMTHQECRDYHISEFPHINLKAILGAIELLETSIDDLILWCPFQVGRGRILNHS